MAERRRTRRYCRDGHCNVVSDDCARGGRDSTGRRGHALVPLALIMVVLACGILAGRDLLHYHEARAEYAALDEEMIRGWEPIEDSGTRITTPIPEADWYPDLQIDYDGYAEINEDFVGVLYFPFLAIRYPVAISQNNVEYLTTTFEGTENPSGSIFMDYQNRRDWSDRNTYIYGHNMRDGSMFGALKDLTQGTVDINDDPYIYVYTSDQILQYQVFCVEVAPSDADFGNIHRDSQYDIYISEIRERAWYWDNGVDLSERPNILTLYTCYGSGHTQKLLVHAALINELEETL